MMGAFYNGVSGVKTQGYGLDVVADNISNVNTVGFKSSTAEFKSLFYQTLGQTASSPTTSQIGLGSTLAATSLNFKQGSLTNTDNVFDMAIQGDGFFGIRGIDGNIYFTRNGDFGVDSEGNLVNRNGLFLQGTMTTISPTTLSQNATQKLGNTLVNGVTMATNQAFTVPTGNTINLTDVGSQTNIKLPDLLFIPAIATTKVDFSGNLDSQKIVDTTTIELNSDAITQAFDETNQTISLSANLNDTPEIQIINDGQDVYITLRDKNGKSIQTRVDADADGNFKVDNLSVKNLNLEEPLVISANATLKQEIPNKQNFSTDVIAANGDKNVIKMEFTKRVPQAEDSTTWDVVANLYAPDNTLIETSNGALEFGPNGALVANTLGAIGGVEINLGSFYDPNVPNSGFDGMKSLVGQDLNLNITKDGEQEGLLKNYTMNANGEIVAIFDNGKQATMAKVALYHFQNDQGLSKIADNTFAVSSNSGQPIFYTDKNGDVIYGATISNRKLEMSNVDLGSALTDMIVIQKAYDANAKSITTSDQMIQRAINMKK
ncbi:flagellar hook protein [Campylobacter iguaniorum]|uniref:flagellar hook protein FlgE n=1 Tax=Campylobacter iguaniorum TaxID=1244531 RepID=UPI0007C8DEE3|nr:flagellar hook-basal body complex protein [Campylobacter iguaniorum]ANE35123.1 flagellar hook protein [Campylobacter iguaniorum]